ncbi:hypothetical protein ACFSTI_01225 [Rhizorhabdus histidinilytica]
MEPGRLPAQVDHGLSRPESLTITPLGGGSTVDAFFIAGEPAHQFSQEVQLNYTSDRLKATAGLFYFREKDASIPGSSPFPRSVLNAFFGVPDDGTPTIWSTSSRWAARSRRAPRRPSPRRPMRWSTICRSPPASASATSANKPS